MRFRNKIFPCIPIVNVIVTGRSCFGTLNIFWGHTHPTPCTYLLTAIHVKGDKRNVTTLFKIQNKSNYYKHIIIHIPTLPICSKLSPKFIKIMYHIIITIKRYTYYIILIGIILDVQAKNKDRYTYLLLVVHLSNYISQFSRFIYDLW